MVELAVAGIQGIAMLIVGWWARDIRKQVRTSNGHSLGQIVETIDQRLTAHNELDDLRFAQLGFRLDSMAAASDVHHEEQTDEVGRAQERHPVF
jgi:hypothetical protein